MTHRQDSLDDTPLQEAAGFLDTPTLDPDFGEDEATAEPADRVDPKRRRPGLFSHLLGTLGFNSDL